ncbi:sugar phosphate nucleotidyltransferase [Candidatus Pelagibacter sp.]|nr:sugar phosphate nucleotidyltransferase [Candidatus Pelagibacter sp.]
MKAILLAGGTGSRLRPATLGINKHLMPVYNKPMIYYSLSILMLCKFREVILICDTDSKKIYEKIFSNGKHLGMKIHIVVQDKANGIPEAFLISKKYLKNESVCLMLGDNFFFGQGFYNLLKKGTNLKKGAFFLAYNVQNPEKYAVLEKKNNKILSIVEKPQNPKTNLAIPGIYFFDKNVVDYCKNLTKSKRGELEIVDLINIYIKKSSVKFEEIGRGISWLDMGSFEDLNDCSNYIRAIEKRQNFMISSPEEIAFLNKWITKKKLIQISNKYNNDYGDYLKKLCL